MHQTNLAGANLSGAYLFEAHLEGSDLTNANLNRADLTYAWLGTGGLGPAIMTGANVNGVTWYFTYCPDGTRSQNNGGTCEGHLFP